MAVGNDSLIKDTINDMELADGDNEYQFAEEHGRGPR